MSDSVSRLLEIDDSLVDERWRLVETWVRERFDRDVSVEAVLFLVGVQSRGRGYEPELEKEAKQDVIMEGTYCAFETLGLYERVGLDSDGSWIWERRFTSLPKLPVEQQEKLLKLGIVSYFADVVPELSDLSDGLSTDPSNPA